MQILGEKSVTSFKSFKDYAVYGCFYTPFILLFCHAWGIHGVYAGYSWSIHGVYVCIGYVSGMYRVCIGKVSKATGRVGGGIPTTDEHGWARKLDIYILGSVKVSEVQWLIHNRGRMFLGGGYTNHG